MYQFDTIGKRKQKLQTSVSEQEFLLLNSEPKAEEYLPGKHLSFHYQNRYLARRRVRRTIRRLRSSNR